MNDRMDLRSLAAPFTSKPQKPMGELRCRFVEQSPATLDKAMFQGSYVCHEQALRPAQEARLTRYLATFQEVLTRSIDCTGYLLLVSTAPMPQPPSLENVVLWALGSHVTPSPALSTAQEPTVALVSPIGERMEISAGALQALDDAHANHEAAIDAEQRVEKSAWRFARDD